MSDAVVPWSISFFARRDGLWGRPQGRPPAGVPSGPGLGGRLAQNETTK